jgi:hypothetical protein
MGAVELCVCDGVALMAISDPYCTAETYRNIIKKRDEGDDVEITLALKAVSRFLDRKLMRFFNKDDQPVARHYWPLGGPKWPLPLGWAEAENPWTWGGYTRMLLVDDMAEPPVGVYVDNAGDGTFTDASDLMPPNCYELWPQNSQLGPEPKPWTSIYVPYWYHAPWGGFPSGKRVKVVCRWGWPSVPPAVEIVTAELTAIWRLESPRATSKVNELEQVTGTSGLANQMVQKLMAEYVRRESLI